MSDLVGQVIANYRLDDWIGDGGMGSVYKAYDLNLDRITALKVMQHQYARLPEFRARVVQEAKASAQLDHPSIVKIYGFGEYEQRLYIAMEYIDGGNLRSHLTRLQKSNRYLPIEQSLQIADQIANALDYAHESGVIHRDVKPSNLLLKRLKKPDRKNEQPFRSVLTDFGLVKVVESQDLSESGTTVGTPTYMSPEQCQGEELDGRSDIYSLGVVLYELITNKLPFEFSSLSEAMVIHLGSTVPDRPTEIRPDLPIVMDSLILRSLSKNPKERYSSGAEMSAHLRSAILALGLSTTQITAAVDSDNGNGSEASTEIDDFSLRIETHGQESRVVKLTHPSIRIGRNADNDIVLPSEEVSRHHATIQFGPDRWSVTDLGGINGTWLDKRRLFSEEEAFLDLGSELEIGPYHLQLEGPAPGPTATEGMPISELPTEGKLVIAAAFKGGKSESSDPLSLILESPSIAVRPGEQIIVNAEVTNHRNQDDRVQLQVRGLPERWLKGRNVFTEIQPGQSAIIPIVVHPPRNTQSPAGKQRFRIELKSKRNPDLSLGVSGSLDIRSYEAFELSMRPRRLKLPGRLQVEIKNIGNTANEFSVVGSDIERIVRFGGERDQINLKPGQTAKVEMQLESRWPKLLGGSESYGFEIEVSGKGGSRQIINGTARRSAVMPANLAYGLIFVIAFLCVLAALFGVVRGGIFGSSAPTVDSGAILGASATVQKATSAAAEAAATSDQATQLAATAAVSGDRDGDGLNDVQENVVGSDPDNHDTDGDSLLDGEEVLTWATNPLRPDTDSDGLVDGAEVHQFKTDPTNPDTDGDGLADAAEIRAGSSPLDPLDPDPSLAPTSPPDDQPAPTLETNSEPPATETPAAEPDPTTTPELNETPEFVMACSDFPPVIDGIINNNEWEKGPLLSFSPEGKPQRTILIFIDHDGSAVYLGYLVSDPVQDLATDGLNIAIDVNNSGDVPDGADRLLQVLRNDVGRMLYGLGETDSGYYWESEYESNNWQFAVGENGDGQWAAEMAIDIANEIPDLIHGEEFAFMVLASYSDILGSWPTGADLNDSSTWQTITFSPCP